MSDEILDAEAKAPLGVASVPRRGGFPFGKLFIAAAAIALFGWIGVRVKASMATHAREETERAKAATVASHEKAAPVELVHGTPGQWEPVVPFDGTLQPLRESDLGFKTGGRLLAIRGRVGERVSAGQVLATLDDTEAAAAEKVAAAQARAAQAQLAMAADSEHRTSGMVASGSSPEALGVQAKHQLELATAQADAAAGQLGLAQVALSNHKLVAPFSGFITKAPSGPGAMVGPGQPLFHLQDTTRLKLVGTVGERDAPLVAIGHRVTLEQGGKTIGGKVVAVLHAVDPTTRRVPIEAELDADAANAALFAGSFERAQIHGEAAIPIVKLPATTLRPGSQDEVMVVEGGRLHARRVEFAAAADGSLLVRHGLTAQDAVLLMPSTDSHDGDAVEVAK